MAQAVGKTIYPGSTLLKGYCWDKTGEMDFEATGKDTAVNRGALMRPDMMFSCVDG